MRSKPTVLKLGGSVVTKKEKLFTPNKRAISRLIKEIKFASVESLLLIHGGGSFGHPVAKKYRINEGFNDPSQIMGFSKTHHAMLSLNKLILDTLIQQEIPAMTIQPSSLVITDNGRMQQMNITIVSKLLELEILPILYGDVVLDSVLGFSILSGDQLVSSLAMKLGADRIILGIDVDGLYTLDPKIDPSAQLIHHITLRELKNLQHTIGDAKVPDVTGGMLGKIRELIPAVEHGIKAIIVNAAKPNNIYRALKDEKVIGTIIEKGDNVA